jgi:undecaprenyl-diphosphatase
MAGGGPIGIDHTWALDQSGIWSSKAQNIVEYGLIAAELGGGIYYGRDNPLGQTFWQSVDSTAISAASAEILKRAFSRARPSQGDDPNHWFQGSCCASFPSGETTLAASVVAPFVFKYARSDPWILALEAIPLYVATARLKNQAHWQTDVIAGWALGTGVGYWTAHREIPISVQILPRGLTVGIYRNY